MIIRAAAAYYPNFCTEINDNCMNKECFKGISGTVWGILADNLNFTYTISKEYAWGSLENGKWGGMIGNLFSYRKIPELSINNFNSSIEFNILQMISFREAGK